MEFTCHGPDDLYAQASLILDELGDTRLVLLEGELGAGKTTLVQALCHQLGTSELPTSPTFSLINEYGIPGGDPVFHMDMYRLDGVDEALHIGVEDYLYSGNWCFIEWPALIESLLEPPFAHIRIEVAGDGRRKIRILKYTGTQTNE